MSELQANNLLSASTKSVVAQVSTLHCLRLLPKGRTGLLLVHGDPGGRMALSWCSICWLSV